MRVLIEPDGRRRANPAQGPRVPSPGARPTTRAPRAPQRPPGFDLLRVPGLGRFLRWRHARVVLQALLALVAAVIVLHGLLGPELAPKNLATLLTWVHYRGVLIVALLAAGNLFCMGCPLLLPRAVARRFFAPVRRLPRALRNKWLASSAFVAVLFAYEAWDLWGDPRWTAGLVLGLFGLALAVDASFRGAPFCKYVCPIGQFNFLASTLSPLEVRARDLDACKGCATKDCIRGRRAPAEPERVEQRGCELALFLPRKVGNLDCTFCLDCVHACPHDNVAIAARVPGEELAIDPVRSGIGRLSRRRDLASLAVLFCFGALLNAFGMVGPVYDLQAAMARALGTGSEPLVLALLFVLALIVLPGLLLGGAGWLALRLSRVEPGPRALWTPGTPGTPGTKRAAGPLATHLCRMAYSLVPLGVGVWAAHYLFHFLTGLWTFVPVAQNALLDLGVPLLGTPDWGRGGLRVDLVQPIELGLLVLGLAGSLSVGLRLARTDLVERGATRTRAGFAPWAAVHVTLFAAAVWLLQQPMEMRGTFL